MGVVSRVAAGTDVDISSIAFWSQPFDERDRAFARLRATDPVSWHAPLETPGLPARFREAGFWALTTVDTISAVSRDTARFSSALGAVSVRPSPVHLGTTMLVTDPPDHRLYRGAVASALSPAGLRALVPRIDRAVRQVILRVAFRSRFDLVADVSAVAPARVLAILLGVPASETDRFVLAVDAYASAGVPAEVVDADAWVGEQGAYLSSLFRSLIRFRSEQPSDDLISLLLRSELPRDVVHGDTLLSTALLLVVAGHDTMKQLITLAVLALLRNPVQRAWLEADFDGRFDAAFDELVRFASPVLSFARTATADLMLGGHQVSAGDKVALFYCSGNRDESVFADPHALLLARHGAHHVGFGGGGVHFCLGAALARIELHAVLGTLLARLPSMRIGEPVLPFNDAVHRVDALPAFTT